MDSIRSLWLQKITIIGQIFNITENHNFRHQNGKCENIKILKMLFYEAVLPIFARDSQENVK